MISPAFVQRSLPLYLFVGLLAAAFANGVRTTWRLPFPSVDETGAGAAGVDLYRDMALAQTILDSGYGPDPTYLGERSWYNPLAPAIIAVVSASSGWPVHTVATQIGAYANLLGPIAFFVMCAVLFDRWIALYAAAGFLFLLSGSLPNWLSASYSPWFMPVNFVQAVFYLSLTVFYMAVRDGRVRMFVAVGVLWGITFLGHTAPALILGGVATLWVIGQAWSHQRARLPATMTVRGAFCRYALMIALALLVSAPFVATIVGHYGLVVRNTFPTSYSDPLLSRELPTLIRLHLTLPMAIVCLGCWLLVTRKFRQTSRSLLLAWGVVTAAFLAYSFLRLAGKLVGFVLPSIVASFHFFFYLKAVAAVLFGLGLVFLGRLAARAFSSRRGRPKDRDTALRIRRAVPALLCVLLLLPHARAYETRPDFAEARRAALVTAKADWVRVFDWLLASHLPTDVALASDRDAWIMCTSSGVKAVAASAGFANPYVAAEPRQADRDRMFDALDRDDSDAFRPLAERYGVTHVVTKSRRSESYDAHTPSDLRLAVRSGSYRLFLVNPRKTALTSSWGPTP